MADAPPPFLRRVRIRNYKSIGKCDVTLRPLTVFVGRNAAGKSNFLDALRFLSDSLLTSVDHAMRDRGGIDAVRRRSTGHPRNFAIEVEAQLDAERTATYGFEVSAKGKGGFAIKRESLEIKRPSGAVVSTFVLRAGELVHSSEAPFPKTTPDRLALVVAGGIPAFADAYTLLSSMGFYNLNPEVMKELQSPDAGELLRRDGANVASVIGRLNADEPDVMKRVEAYLTTIVPGISGVSRVALGPRETLEFKQNVEGSEYPWKFYAVSVSDGTLRALGILAACMQFRDGTHPVPLVGIEEPETALHPAASGALMDALGEAAEHTQILVTSHSGTLLDEVDFERHGVLVVVSNLGKTEIAPPDSASLEAIREHLYAPGELQRMDQLEPDPADLARQRQMKLFEDA